MSNGTGAHGLEHADCLKDESNDGGARRIQTIDLWVTQMTFGSVQSVPGPIPAKHALVT